MSIACLHCGRSYTDTTGQLPALLALAAEGKLAVVLGCGGCGALYLPAAPATPAALGVARTQASAPAVPEGASRYAVVRVIAEGGMGRTHLALDRTTGREVCLKQLLPGVDATALRQEWQALARLDHPNIVRLLDFFEARGAAHLVMEFIEGASLAAFLRARGALPAPLALDLARQVGAAVAYAHERAVIHRDLKPGNVMLSWQGAGATARVLDFGLAIVDRRDALGAVTGAGAPVGTPYYMAPEQYEGVVLSPACDVYALGAILGEMVAGRPLFGAKNVAALYHEKARGRDGVDLGAGAADAVRALVRECTRAEPAGRPTARALVDRLAALVPAVGGGAVLAPVNLGFEQPSAGGPPPGWSDGREFVPGASGECRAEVLPRPDAPRARCLRLASAPGAAAGAFGTVMQRCPAGHLAGRTVRLTARVRAEHAAGWAGLWLRADDARGAMLHFDNMHDRALRGTTAWRECAVEAALPAGVAWLNYGVLLVGAGAVWADDVALTAARDGGAFERLDADPVAPSLGDDGPLT